jgi:ATP-binding protein involved in chromosome partitioning
VRLVRNVEFLIVTTPSLLAFETVKKQVRLLQDLKIPIIGIVENMTMNRKKTVEQKTEKLGVKFLAGIPYDSKVEEAIGDEKKLLSTTIAQRIRNVAESIITQ